MKAEFQELMDRYLDGSASAEEIRKVDEWLRRDPSARETLFQTAAVEVDLRRLLATPFTRPLAEGERRPAPSRRLFACAAVAAVAGWALALLMVGQYRAKCGEHQAALERLAELDSARPQPAATEAPDRPHAVGRLIETRGLVLATLKGQTEAIPVAAEFPIPLDGSLWTCPWGGAAMRFADGASMDLERSTEVVISQSETARRAAIKSGIVMLNMMRGPAEGPIVIATPHATVKVIKAEVAVSAEANRTIVEVAQGQIQVTRIADGRTLTVAANHYVIISPAAAAQVMDGRLAWHLEPVRP